jgi:hypothetical protein
MKVSHIGILVIAFLVIAIMCAGCSSASTSTPSAGTGQAAPAASAGSGAAASQGSAATPASAGSSGSASGSDLFGGLSYNWVEYKIAAGSGSQGMTVYYKYDKSGKCSMRFEGGAAANLPANMQNIDCSAGQSTGTKAADNPNTITSDEKVYCSGDESVTVPAGTFTATKCTVSTTNGAAETVWVVKNKFLVKVEVSSSGQNAMTMELNQYG